MSGSRACVHLKRLGSLHRDLTRSSTHKECTKCPYESSGHDVPFLVSVGHATCSPTRGLWLHADVALNRASNCAMLWD